MQSFCWSLLATDAVLVMTFCSRKQMVDERTFVVLTECRSFQWRSSLDWYWQFWDIISSVVDLTFSSPSFLLTRSVKSCHSESPASHRAPRKPCVNGDTSCLALNRPSRQTAQTTWIHAFCSKNRNCSYLLISRAHKRSKFRKFLDLENTPYSSSESSESDIVNRQSGGEKLKYILKFYMGVHVTWYRTCTIDDLASCLWAHEVWGTVSRKPLEVETWVQRTTNRK